MIRQRMLVRSSKPLWILAVNAPMRWQARQVPSFGQMKRAHARHLQWCPTIATPVFSRFKLPFLSDSATPPILSFWGWNVIMLKSFHRCWGSGSFVFRFYRQKLPLDCFITEPFSQGTEKPTASSTSNTAITPYNKTTTTTFKVIKSGTKNNQPLGSLLKFISYFYDLLLSNKAQESDLVW